MGLEMYNDCPDCGERYNECTCDLCEDCGEELDDCICPTCEDCGELEKNCKCVKCPHCGEALAGCLCPSEIVSEEEARYKMELGFYNKLVGRQRGLL
jgi:hypothetical protein